MTETEIQNRLKSIAHDIDQLSRVPTNIHNYSTEIIVCAGAIKGRLEILLKQINNNK